MTNNEFNIGDTVRFKGKKKIHTITGINEYGQYIVSEYPNWSFSAEQLEHAELPDRKTAFLTELQALLRKYDARIYDEDEYKVIFDLGIHCEKGVHIECMGTNGEVNADNIMDFDKE